MIPEQCIKIAIENGYDFWGYKDFKMDDERVVLIYNGDCMDERPLSDIAQDPAFWQALGKGFGWDEKAFCNHCYIDKQSWEEKPRKCAGDWLKHEFNDWLYHALRYFETLLTGGNLEQFWKKLLPKE